MAHADATRTTSLTTLIGTNEINKPLGLKLFGLCFQFKSTQCKRTYYKTLVIILTFIAYATFHMGRRPFVVVKNVLNHDTDYNHEAPNNNVIDFHLEPQNNQSTNSSGNWAPFDNDATANQLLALLDTSWLLSYAVCMFFSGVIAERVNLRYFVSSGSILSGMGLVAFGLARTLEIHTLSYFVIVQLFSGAVQSSGWPVVVTCVSNWFEPSKRGLIYGIWNSHTSIGNILGATISGYFVETDWGMSFFVPGFIMIATGILLLLFLTPHPSDVGLTQVAGETAVIIQPKESQTTKSQLDLDTSPSIPDVQNEEAKAVSFMTALKIPGVIEFSICLFFSKLVSYTFLQWLPRYIAASTDFSSEDAAYLSTLFDIGGILGAILAGHLSDRFRMNGLICNIMLILAIPSMFAYQQFGSKSKFNNISLQLITGFLVNGPYCLITTAVSADLGNRIKDGKAMATVSAIIDGMGSIGAVIGPLFAGLVSGPDNWQPVFIMLMVSDVFASICLMRVTINELRARFSGPSDEIPGIATD